jgi:hypothetical protein
MATTGRSEVHPGCLPATSTSPVQGTSLRPGLWSVGAMARPGCTAATAGQDVAALQSKRLSYSCRAFSCRAGSASGPVDHRSSTSVSRRLWRPGTGRGESLEHSS